MRQQYVLALALIVCIMAAGCSAKLEVLDKNGKLIPGVPFRTTVPYIVQGNHDRVDHGRQLSA